MVRASRYGSIPQIVLFVFLCIHQSKWCSTTTQSSCFLSSNCFFSLLFFIFCLQNRSWPVCRRHVELRGVEQLHCGLLRRHEVHRRLQHQRSRRAQPLLGAVSARDRRHSVSLGSAHRGECRIAIPSDVFVVRSLFRIESFHWNRGQRNDT